MFTLGALEAAYLGMCKRALKGDDAALCQAIGIMLEVVPAEEAARERRAAEVEKSTLKLAAILGITPEELRKSE